MDTGKTHIGVFRCEPVDRVHDEDGVRLVWRERWTSAKNYSVSIRSFNEKTGVTPRKRQQMKVLCVLFSLVQSRYIRARVWRCQYLCLSMPLSFASGSSCKTVLHVSYSSSTLKRGKAAIHGSGPPWKISHGFQRSQVSSPFILLIFSFFQNTLGSTPLIVI